METGKMVFDWDKAAKILKERNIKNASAGLEGNWQSTGGEILVDGKIPEDTYTYLSSTSARPQLHIDTGESSEVIDCFIMDYETEYNEKTFWPESAKKKYILINNPLPKGIVNQSLLIVDY